MSLVPEGSSEATIYVDEQRQRVPTPLVLHYEHPESGAKVSEVGWTAGGHTNNHSSPEPCAVHKPLSGPVALGGLSGSNRGYLAFTYFIEYEGESKEIAVNRPEVLEFGEGAGANGCPKASVTTPTQAYAGNEDVHTLPAGTQTTLSSYISELEGGKPGPALANPKSVEWIIKYFNANTGEHEEHRETVPYTLNGPQSEQALKLRYTFARPGSYEVQDVVTSDDLSDEIAQPAAVDKVTVTALPLAITMSLPTPTSVPAQEAEAEFSGKVENAAEPAAPLHLTRITWTFGEGSSTVISAQNWRTPTPTRRS